jgi:hypothetical protein
MGEEHGLDVSFRFIEDIKISKLIQPRTDGAGDPQRHHEYLPIPTA